MKTNNSKDPKKEDLISKRESDFFKKETLADNDIDSDEISKRISALELKLKNQEKEMEKQRKQIHFTTKEAIKSVGRISLVISLGLTAIVSLIGIVDNRQGFEAQQVLWGIGIIFVGMTLFFMLSL